MQFLTTTPYIVAKLLLGKCGQQHGYKFVVLASYTPNSSSHFTQHTWLPFLCLLHENYIHYTVIATDCYVSTFADDVCYVRHTMCWVAWSGTLPKITSISTCLLKYIPMCCVASHLSIFLVHNSQGMQLHHFQCITFKNFLDTAEHSLFQKSVNTKN